MRTRKIRVDPTRGYMSVDVVYFNARYLYTCIFDGVFTHFDTSAPSECLFMYQEYLYRFVAQSEVDLYRGCKVSL